MNERLMWAQRAGATSKCNAYKEIYSERKYLAAHRYQILRIKNKTISTGSKNIMGVIELRMLTSHFSVLQL